MTYPNMRFKQNSKSIPNILLTIITASLILISAFFAYNALLFENTVIASNINPFFITNEGQAGEDILFYFQGVPNSIYFTKDKIVTQSVYYSDDVIPRPALIDEGTGEPTINDTKTSGREVTYHQTFLNSNEETSKVYPIEPNETVVNYFVSDISKSNIKTFKGIMYKNLYDNIDFKYYFDGKKVKYDAVVKPGAKPTDIQIQFSGVEKLEIDNEGNLLVTTPAETLTHKYPYIYQKYSGKTVEINGSYKILENNVVTYEVEKYDTNKSLIIDPEFSYLYASTYIGGSTYDYGVLIDYYQGAVYATSETKSSNYPTTDGAYDTTFNDTNSSYDIVISKFNDTLTTLVASTFLGGNNTERPGNAGIKFSGDSLYLTGYTSSSDFPTTASPYDNSLNGTSDGFVAKLSTDLTELQASTYFGGSVFDSLSGLAVIPGSGNILVSGSSNTSEIELPGYQSTCGSSTDAVIVIFNPSLSELVGGTYLGGSATDGSNRVIIDSSNNYVYVVGNTYYTELSDFPIVGDGYQQEFTGTTSSDSYIAKFSADLTSLVVSTYLGGSSTDSIYGLVENNSKIYVVGITKSDDFPVTPGAYDTAHDAGGTAYYDIFISKLDKNLSTLEASTYLGGTGNEASGGTEMHLLEAYDSDSLLISGWTVATDYPTTESAYDREHTGGTNDGILTMISGDLSTLETSTFIGGTGSDRLGGSTVKTGGDVIYVTGNSYSSDYPTSATAYDTSANGSCDTVITGLTSVSNAVPEFTIWIYIITVIFCMIWMYRNVGIPRLLRH